MPLLRNLCVDVRNPLVGCDAATPPRATSIALALHKTDI
jgi:hypothetical protein